MTTLLKIAGVAIVLMLPVAAQAQQQGSNEAQGYAQSHGAYGGYGYGGAYARYGGYHRYYRY